MKINNSQQSFAANGVNNYKQDNKNRKIAKDFESVMLSSMLKEMVKDVKMSGEEASETQDEFFKSLLMDNCAKQISNTKKGIGIASEIYKSMLRDNGKK